METVRTMLLALVSNNSTTDQVQYTTQQVTEVFQNADYVKYVFNFVFNDPEPSIRQTGSVLLSTHLRDTIWLSIGNEQRCQIKQDIIKTLLNETNRAASNNLIDLMGHLLKMDADKVWWLEISRLMCSLSTSTDVAANERGTYMMARLSELYPELFVQITQIISDFVDAALGVATATQVYDTPMLLNVYKILSNLAENLVQDSEADSFYRKTVPSLLQAAFYMKNDIGKFSAALQVIETLVDVADYTLDSHVACFSQFCHQVLSDSSISEEVEAKTFSLLEYTIEAKGYLFREQNLLEPAFKMAFTAMAKNNKKVESWEHMFWCNCCELNILHSGMRLVEIIFDASVPTILPQMLMNNMREAKQSGLFTDFSLLRACYCCIGLLMERSCIFYEIEFDKLMNFVMLGLQPSNPSLHNAALFAMGSLFKEMGPSCRKFASTSIKTLLCMLRSKIEGDHPNPDPLEMECILQTLNSVISKLEERKLLELEPLLGEVIKIMQKVNKPDTLNKTLHTFNCLIKTVKENISPYVPYLVNVLQMHTLKPDSNRGDIDRFQFSIYCIETLNFLIRNCGESYNPFAMGTLQYILNLMSSPVAEDCASSCFRVLGSLSFVAKEDMSQIFPSIVPQMMNYLESREQAEVAQQTEQEEENDDEEPDENGVADYDDEKDAALSAFKDFLTNSPTAIRPYFRDINGYINNIMKGNEVDFVMQSSIQASVLVFRALAEDDLCYSSCMRNCLISLNKIVQRNSDEDIVHEALQGMIDLVNAHPKKAIQAEPMRQLLLITVHKVLKGGTRIQRVFNRNCASMPNVGPIIGFHRMFSLGFSLLNAFARALGPDHFLGYFDQIYGVLFTLIKCGKDDPDFKMEVADCLKACSDCFEILEFRSAKYLSDFLPLVLECVGNDYFLVRQNAVNCLGRLVYYSKAQSSAFYDLITNTLSFYITNVANPDDFNSLCGCLACIVMAVPSGTHTQVSLDLVLQHSPLVDFKEDHEYILKCFESLLVQNTVLVDQYFNQVLEKTLNILMATVNSNQKTKNAGKQFLRGLYMKFQNRFDRVISSQPEAITFLQNFMR